MSEPIRCEPPRKILGSNGSSNANTTLNLSSSSQEKRETTANHSQNNCHQQMERLRLATNVVGQQEMHALWPYGTTAFLSPMLPTANMALPYALAGTLPYTAVPIYQSLPTGGPQQCTLSPVSSSSSASSSVGNHQNALQHQQQQSQQQQTLRSNLPTVSVAGNNSGSGGVSGGNNPPPNQNDSNKINIQIGLQCVSQNTPLNFNSMNDSMAKVNFLSFCNPTMSQMGEDCKDSSSPQRASPPLSGADDTAAAGGDAANLHSPNCNGNTVILTQAKFNELTRLALRGSEIAEKLAYTHRNRPCFKKIDSLCARMKQDLIRPDGVLANINSQGIAWAVKDFIFVFTRVINAWIIIKGYVYNTPEGLNKVKAALSPEFAASFAAWQDTTMDFIENLIKSFVNLDNLVQSQKNVYQKSDGYCIGAHQNGGSAKVMTSVNPLLEDASFDFLNTTFEKTQHNTLNKNYIYTMVKDSEGSQRQATVNGTYFQTGTYNPIKKDALLVEHTPSTAANSGGCQMSARSLTSANAPPLLVTTNSTPIPQYSNETTSDYWTSGSDFDPTTAAAVNAVAASSEYLKLKEKIPSNWLNYSFAVPDANLDHFPQAFQDLTVGVRKSCNKKSINIILDRLMAMENADMFFRQHFTKNYFPDFICKHKHDFLDVHTIIMKCENDGYQHLHEVVHDIKNIIYIGKDFLKVRTK